MKDKAIIIDLDNVIVKTSLRKQKVLSKRFDTHKTLEEIESDYELNQVFGSVHTDQYQKFWHYLNSTEGIEAYEAEPYEGSVEVINDWINSNIRIVILTSRPVSIESQTVAELKEYGIEDKDFELICAPDKLLLDNKILQFKKEEVSKCIARFSVITVVGDRLSDIQAGKDNYLSTIYFNPSKPIEFDNPMGHFHCKDWNQVKMVANTLNSGTALLSNLRKLLIDQYSKWLSDIDNKLRISVTIAGILSAVSGKLIFENLNFTQSIYCPSFIASISLILCFIFSMISILFCIRGYTSRHTSGSSASRIITPQNNSNWIIRQYRSLIFSYFTLINSDKKNQFLSDQDYINRYNRIKNRDKELPYEHLNFFYNKYKTYDEDALLNRRFFAVLATNYSKVYPEIIASNYLMRSVIMIIIYVLCQILIHIFK